MQRQPSMGQDILIRPAEPGDLPQMGDLLLRAGLIVAGVEDHLEGFFIAADSGRLVGSAGVEVYGDVALLRSVAVDEEFRGQGLGRRLVTAALAQAGRRGARDVVLLTTSAAPFFRRLGFRETDRQTLDPRLAASKELDDECCATAVAMISRLPSREDSLGAPVSAQGGMNETAIKQVVRRHYAGAAEATCCGGGSPSCCGAPTDERGATRPIPSFGCGSPVEAAEPKPGEIVLDLGSGRGLDAFRAAERVGAAGRVIGVDMTPEMVWRAREDAARLGFTQVEFRLGEIEALPLADASVDVVISNCVINLVPDKDRTFAEAFRVLRPAGRLVVADVVRARPRSADGPSDLASWAACVEGADEEGVYLNRLRRAGFTDIEVLDRQSGEIYSATVRARKPAAL